MSGPMPTPDGFEWIGSVHMSRGKAWLDNGRFKLDGVKNVEIDPSGRWLMAEFYDGISWIRIPDDAHSIDWEPQSDLRELPKPAADTKAAEAIRKTGCICPLIDVTTIGGGYETMPGYDSRCGMHDRKDAS